ncbi:MAG: FAD-dependent thymidylate synthase [Nitrososphaeria archaeon]|nr:FAD-dependent thymidylate synthase [Nitrososphaeria archaeon]
MEAKVYLISYTPMIERVCAAAMRSCYSMRSAHEIFLDQQNFTEYDVERLIKKAIELGHYSVLEHGSLTFSLQGISRALTHQLVRHRMASYSQQSQRHVKVRDDGQWYIIPKSLRNCKEKIFFDEKEIEISYEKFMKLAEEYYKMLLNKVGKEDARFILPNATLTHITLTANPRELRHIYSLRCDPAAQWEIRDICWTMLALSYLIAPNIFSTLDQPAKNSKQVIEKLETLKNIIKRQKEKFDRLSSGTIYELDLQRLELEHDVRGFIIKL